MQARAETAALQAAASAEPKDEEGLAGAVYPSLLSASRATCTLHRWFLRLARQFPNCAFQETSDYFFSTVTALLSGEWILNESSWSWTSPEKSGPRSIVSY